MTEYAPLYKPGQEVTRKASAAITGGQVVEITGADTVGPAAATSKKVVGVATFDAAVGELVTVVSGGVQRPVASGAVTAGDLVVTAAAGKVATSAAPAAGTQIGIAHSTAADGEPVEVVWTRA